MSNFVLSILVEAKDAASGVLGGVGDALSGLGKAGLVVAGAGMAALGGALFTAVGNAIDAQDVFAQTRAVVESTGGAAGMTAEQLADLASSLSAAASASTFGDEAILQGENLLATFTNIGKDVFPLATQSMVDMATAMGTDVKGGAIQLGKALNDPVAGISALSRVGVSFTEDQKAVIKSLVETGDVAGAQKIILAELAKEFGGSAAAAAQTFSGQLGTLKDKFGEVLEGVGLKLLPILTQFVGFLNSPEVQTGIAAFADGLVNGIGQAANLIGPILAGLGPILQGAFQAFTTEMLPALLAGWQQLQGGLTAAQPIFAGLAGAVQPLIAAFTDAKNPIDGVLAALTQISPTFALVKAGIDAALPPIQQIVTSVFGILSGFLAEHGAKIRSDVGGAWQQTQAIINAVIPPIQLIISTVFGAIAGFLQAHGAEIQAFLGQTWDTIAEIVRVALELIQAIIVPAIQAIAGFISSHGAEIQALITNAWNAIRLIIDTALSLIKGLLTTALQLIKGDWAGAWETIKQMSAHVVQNLIDLFTIGLDNIRIIFEGVWTGIKTFFQATLDSLVGWVIQTFQGIINAINGFIGTAKSAAGGVGDAIVNGITSGIANGAGAIVRAAKDAAMAALNAAKSALGIASPSMAFREQIGQNAGLGIALGLQDMIPNVTQSASELAGAGLAGAAQTTTNITNVLNYQGAAQTETDARDALRTQALLMGAT